MLNTKLLGSVSAAPAEYVEDVFSTYLYSGNSANNTITNGIDLSTKGGLVWMKGRTIGDGTQPNALFDTARGLKQLLRTNTTNAQVDESGGGGGGINSWNTTGFTITDAGFNAYYNQSGENYCSWTFRKAPKFFDIVTYTGNGSTQNISHNLGSTPGMVIVKRTDSTGDWRVYHRSDANQGALNLTDAFIYSGIANVTSTSFTPQGTGSGYNVNGATYVAYLFAHNAGGFGAAGTDNVISCGSFTGGSTLDVNLGYEPQYVMVKASSGSSDWMVFDTMRGMSLSSYRVLYPNLSQGEDTGGSTIFPTATGFTVNPANLYGNQTYIYMAIRRPMKPPTSGTQVFLPTTYTGNGSTQTITTNFPVDFSLFINRTKSNFDNNNVFDRLRGGTRYLATNVTDAEGSLGSSVAPLYDSNTGVNLQAATITNGNSASIIVENFRRATGFFDVVCYRGTGGMVTLNHNLGAVPELMIVKARGTNSFGTSNNWFVYCSYLSGTPTNQYLNLNTTNAVTSNTNVFSNAAPTSTTFGVGGLAQMDSGVNAVAYLFATLAGVSKVGTYNGTGANTTNQIDCGFTSGARFVMIKRTNATGNWFVFDTARGITSGNDPFLALNNTNAENGSFNVITPYAAGFNINDASDVGLNETGGTFIYLAIA